MIVIDKAIKIYPVHLDKEKPERERAIDEINLELCSGKIHSIIGRNGSGKSTLIKSIMGLIKLTSGHIYLDGLSPRNPDSRKRVGYLPEVFGLEDNMSVHSILSWQSMFYGYSKKEARLNAEKWSSIIKIDSLTSKGIKSLSKGQRQRVGLAMALVHEPDIIILDEPMSGLDPVGRWEFSNIIELLRKEGKTILLCSHLFDDVERFSDFVHIIDNGKHLRSLKAEDIGSGGLESLFLKEIGIEK